MTSARVTLDEARDFLYTSMRSAERFVNELKAVVEILDKKQATDEWLEEVQLQLEKGNIFMQQQQEIWEAEQAKMDAYIASVRALADELALKELSLAEKAMEEAEEVKQDARTIHPELHRFKLEKRARIVGKYGGSPALGAMVMPHLARDAILKATGSPAAREIQYSKAEGKDAQYLAQVMQFKKEKKEKGLEGWQAEVTVNKGNNFISEQQAKGVKPEPSPHTPQLPKDLAERLAARQAQLDAEEERRAQEAQKASAAVSAAPKLTGELADKLQRRKQAEKDAAEAKLAAEREAAKLAAERAEVEAGIVSTTPVQLPPGANPMVAVTAQLSGVLKQRRVAEAIKKEEEAGAASQQEEAPTPPPAWGVPKLRSASSQASTPAPATNGQPAGMPSELMARFQKMRKEEADI